ncbi:MAG: DUF6151 family protein [Litoreibacter sp.]|nr:DUF6151 family protein [Litoreibacter sp.]MCY4333099.1 DUF6151 family protein [Litoreibacter sp.]
MADKISISCKCGAFKAVLNHDRPDRCNHAVCYCVDCQAAARHLGEWDRITDEKGGTEIYQTVPEKLEIVEGADKLAVMRLAPKGLYRWHTSCCGTSLCNTLGKAKFSFVGLVVENMEPKDGLGPVQFRHKPEQALAPVEEPPGNLAFFAVRTLRNAAIALMTGGWRKTPFFDATTGLAVSKPVVLSADERAAAYKA